MNYRNARGVLIGILFLTFALAVGPVLCAEGPAAAGVDGAWEQLADGSAGQIVEFHGAGGVKIAAYIRKPAGSGPFPVVIMLHGAEDSKAATYGMGRSQKSPTQDFMAAGWVVFAIDFRPKAETPAPDSVPLNANPLWEDAIAGVAKARSYPFVDPKRVAILGGSRGGQIMSRLASRVEASCGVLCAPAGLDMIELAKVIQTGQKINPALKSMVRALERRTGATIEQIGKDPAKYGYRSALTEAPEVRFPLLLISGRNDVSSPIPVLDAYAQRLRAAGKEVETYFPDNGPHGFYFGLPQEIPETKEAARRAVAFIGTRFTPGSPRQGGQTGAVYRGFTIDDSRVQDLADLEAIQRATKEQIDIVCAVGVLAETLKFFQSVPFVLVPTGALASGSPGLYAGKSQGVKVTARIVSIGHKPVLLHELLHAYHNQRLPDGFKNKEVSGYFARAKVIAAYAPASHMMQNPGEYFACAATTYLFGVTGQEPFQRDKVKTSQPEFFAYLKSLFGPDAGDYAGSLTR